jgi:hypothetical protein
MQKKKIDEVGTVSPQSDVFWSKIGHFLKFSLRKTHRKNVHNYSLCVLKRENYKTFKIRNFR